MKNASKEEIKQAFRKLATKFHPDKASEGVTESATKHIYEADETLIDDQKRAKYNNNINTTSANGAHRTTTPNNNVNKNNANGAHWTTFSCTLRNGACNYTLYAADGTSVHFKIRHFTFRRFLSNAALLGVVLFGGIYIVGESSKALLGLRNSEKSSEDAMDSVEKA